MKYLKILLISFLILQFLSCDDSDIDDKNFEFTYLIYINEGSTLIVADSASKWEFMDAECTDCCLNCFFYREDDEHHINKILTDTMLSKKDLHVKYQIINRCRKLKGLPIIDSGGIEFGTVKFEKINGFSFDDHRIYNTNDDTSYLAVSVDSCAKFLLKHSYDTTLFDEYKLTIKNSGGNVHFKQNGVNTNSISILPSKKLGNEVTDTITIYASNSIQPAHIEFIGINDTSTICLSSNPVDSASGEDYLKIIPLNTIVYNKEIYLFTDSLLYIQSTVTGHMKNWLNEIDLYLSKINMRIDTSNYSLKYVVEYDKNKNGKFDTYPNATANDTFVDEVRKLENGIINYLKTTDNNHVKNKAVMMLTSLPKYDNYRIKQGYDTTTSANDIHLYAMNGLTEADTGTFRGKTVWIGPPNGDTALGETCYVSYECYDNIDSVFKLTLTTNQTSFTKPKKNHPNTHILSVQGSEAGWAISPDNTIGDFLVMIKDYSLGTDMGNASVIHEFGHTQELFHVDDSSNLMFPYMVNKKLSINYRYRDNCDFDVDIASHDQDNKRQSQWLELRQLEDF